MFRILSILPGSFEDMIECQMRHAYLQHEDEGLTVCDRNPGGEAPEYEALSYVWGVDKDIITITIDGFEVEIGKNLECALRHLRLKTESWSIWVDALCINQLDPIEKSVQILRMNEVYHQASIALAWLGAVSETSAVAFEAIERLGGVETDMEEEASYKNQIDGQTVILRPKSLTDLADIHDLSTIDLVSLMELFTKSDWWTRIWIIQESAYAQQARLVCGKISINWDSISNILEINPSIKDNWKMLEAVLKEKLEMERYDARSPVGNMGLAKRVGTTLRTLLHRYKDFKATDPRDNIYALLGLRDFPTAGIVVDYARSARELYTNAAEVMIRNTSDYGRPTTPSLNLICAAYRGAGSTHNLPSWVPDWSIPQDYWLFDLSEYDFIKQLYRASRKEPFLPSLKKIDDGTLVVKGILWDKQVISLPTSEIEGLGDLESQMAYMMGYLKICNLAMSVADNLVYQDKNEAFMRTLLADSNGDSNGDSRISEGILAAKFRNPFANFSETLESLSLELVDHGPTENPRFRRLSRDCR
jgi:hypothetical protein